MGPYSEEKQNHRRSNILKILKNKKLPDDMRIIWQNHYNNLATHEDEYNKRVYEVFRDVNQMKVPW